MKIATGLPLGALTVCISGAVLSSLYKSQPTETLTLCGEVENVQSIDFEDSSNIRVSLELKLPESTFYTPGCNTELDPAYHKRRNLWVDIYTGTQLPNFKKGDRVHFELDKRSTVLRESTAKLKKENQKYWINKTPARAKLKRITYSTN